MFKNVYLLLIGVFAMMLVGFLNVSDSETIVTTIGSNLLEPVLQGYTGNGITITTDDNNIYTINGTSTIGTGLYISMLDLNVSNGDWSIIDDVVSTLPFSANDYTLSITEISGTTDSVGIVYVNKLMTFVLDTSPSKLVDNATLITDTYSFTLFIGATGTVYDNYTFSVMFETGSVANEFSTYGTIETLVTVNGTNDYIQSIIKASPYLVSLFVIVGVVSFLVTGKKEDE